MAAGKVLPISTSRSAREPQRAQGDEAAGQYRQVLQRIRSWRKGCPDLAIRSTFIVGFPGETEQDFEELLSFVKARIARAGCFKYEPVEGQLPMASRALCGRVKDERWHRFMQAQQAVSTEIMAARVRPHNRRARRRGGRGRGDWPVEWDAPDIGSSVFLDGTAGVKVRRPRARDRHSLGEYDLWAERVV